ncbi:MAG TPA: SIS domain-containing protein [Baekduia sp.]|nr:SIS domain-containing protein [Baekduia sp.]
MSSHMRLTLQSQPAELARVLDDPEPARAAARRLRGRRVLLVGVGTSWHAAQHGAWLLRAAGVRASAAHAADLAPYAVPVDAADGIVVLSHTGRTGFSVDVLERARAAGAEVVHLSAVGAGGDVETVAPETSYAYTASHTAALARLAQIAVALGGDLGGDLAGVPDAVARVLARSGPMVEVPERLVELIGAGPNGPTAQEGALKIREASYVAAEGLSAEQFLHGPSVALDAQDALVVLDGGGPMAARTEAIAVAVEVTGARVARFTERELGEQLSIFALTVVVQRIALELAEARGVSPDRFRYEEDPRREAAFEGVGF